MSRDNQNPPATWIVRVVPSQLTERQEMRISITWIRSLGLGLLMACAAAGAIAAGETGSVTETVDLAAAPSRTWDMLNGTD